MHLGSVSRRLSPARRARDRAGKNLRALPGCARGVSQEATMADCLFCGIIEGEIKGDIVYRDERIVAFRDVRPQAPVHILIVPVKHIATLSDLNDEDKDVVGAIHLVASRLAEQ